MLTALSACMSDGPAFGEQAAQAQAIESMAQFTTSHRDVSFKVSAEIDGCIVHFDTTATSGERAGQLDHRDTFRLGEVMFASTADTPPYYVVSIVPGIRAADDPLVPMNVAYEGINADAITRVVPMWKDPREPFTQGPVIDGIEYATGPRQRGSFILASRDQMDPAHAFVSALVAYEETFCRAGLG